MCVKLYARVCKIRHQCVKIALTGVWYICNFFARYIKLVSTTVVFLKILKITPPCVNKHFSVLKNIFSHNILCVMFFNIHSVCKFTPLIRESASKTFNFILRLLKWVWSVLNMFGYCQLLCLVPGYFLPEDFICSTKILCVM